MNTIREIQSLNKRELENGVSTEASWHADYRDTAYIYIGGLPFDLSEGDVMAIFSQFGEPVYVNIIRDKESGKSKGFAFLKYEDQRSTDLAVDNLGGVIVLGRVLKVDHTRYKRRDDEEEMEREQALSGQKNIKPGGLNGRQSSEDEAEEQKRPLLREEIELAALIREHDEDDPMKEYLVQEKKEEVAKALAVMNQKDHKGGGEKKHNNQKSHRRDRHNHKRQPRRHNDGSDSGAKPKSNHRTHRSRRSSSCSPR